VKMCAIFAIFLIFFYGTDAAPAPHYEFSYACKDCTCHYLDNGRSIVADCHGRPMLSAIPWTDFTDTELERLTTIDMADTLFCKKPTGTLRGQTIVRGVFILCGNSGAPPLAVAATKTDPDQPPNISLDTGKDKDDDMDDDDLAAPPILLDDTDDDDHALSPALLALTATTLIAVVCGLSIMIIYIHKVRHSYMYLHQ